MQYQDPGAMLPKNFRWISEPARAWFIPIFEECDTLLDQSIHTELHIAGMLRSGLAQTAHHIVEKLV
jgi:hypothetical protein